MWLDDHIADEALETTDKALNLVEALGRYYIRLLEFNGQSSARIGDVTVRTETAKLLEIEKMLRDEAIVSAGDILKDGDFYFAAC